MAVSTAWNASAHRHGAVEHWPDGIGPLVAGALLGRSGEAWPGGDHERWPGYAALILGRPQRCWRWLRMVAGVGVAPAQAGLQPGSQHGVIGVVRPAPGEGPQRPELRFDRIGPGCVGRGKAQLVFVPRQATFLTRPTPVRRRSGCPCRRRSRWGRGAWITPPGGVPGARPASRSRFREGRCLCRQGHGDAVHQPPPVTSPNSRHDDTVSDRNPPLHRHPQSRGTHPQRLLITGLAELAQLHPCSWLPAVRDLAVQHQHAQPDGQGTWWRLRLRSSTGAPRRVRGALRPPEGLRIADAQAPGAGLDPATTAARGAARVGRPGPARPARGGQAASPRTAVSTVFKGLTL